MRSISGGRLVATPHDADRRQFLVRWYGQNVPAVRVVYISDRIAPCYRRKQKKKIGFIEKINRKFSPKKITRFILLLQPYMVTR